MAWKASLVVFVLVGATPAQRVAPAPTPVPALVPNQDVVNRKLENVRIAAAAAANNAENAAASASAAAAIARQQNINQVIIQVSGFISLILVFMFREFREDKQRNWAKQDAAEQKAKLAQIHTLVNSGMTEALQRELVAHKSLLILLSETKIEKEGLGAMVAPEVQNQIDAARLTVRNLTEQLAARMAATATADREALQGSKSQI